MNYKLLADDGAEKSWVFILETGDEVTQKVLEFARSQSITAARFSAIGAFSSAKLGYFDWESKKYQPISAPQQVEVVSLTGDIAIENGQPKLHAHAVLGKPDGSAVCGHLMEAHVRPTLEIMLEQTPKRLERQFDPESGIALIRP